MLIENVSSLPDENKYLNEARHFRSEKMLDFQNLISGKLWPAGITRKLALSYQFLKSVNNDYSLLKPTPSNKY